MMPLLIITIAACSGFLAKRFSNSKSSCVNHGKIHKLPTHTATIFPSVVRLQLFTQYHDPEVNMLKFLPCLLKFFPSLQSLYVQMPFYNPAFDGGVMHSDNIPAPCVHTNLKEAELGWFDTKYIAYASFLLKSAVNLERMVITKALKRYAGCGVVHHLNFPLLTRKESECIGRALQGIAASSKVELIIPSKVPLVKIDYY